LYKSKRTSRLLFLETSGRWRFARGQFALRQNCQQQLHAKSSQAGNSQLLAFHPRLAYAKGALTSPSAVLPCTFNPARSDLRSHLACTVECAHRVLLLHSRCTSWGFAQRPTTNGVLSLDSPFRRSVQWLQLARRPSPPNGLGGLGFSELPATTRAAPENGVRTGIHQFRIQIKGVQGQLPAGARWTLRGVSNRLHRADPKSHSRPADFAELRLWPGGKRENRARDV
jgi:hypothetical protein